MNSQSIPKLLSSVFNALAINLVAGLGKALIVALPRLFKKVL